MDETAALDPLWCHFGGAEERFASLALNRQQLLRAPVVTLECLSRSRSADASSTSTSGIALALFDADGAIATNSRGVGSGPVRRSGATLFDWLPTAEAAVCESMLPEVVAYKLAHDRCDIVWGIHLAAVVVSPGGGRTLLYGAFTDAIHRDVERTALQALASGGEIEGHIAEVLRTAAARKVEKPAEEEVMEPLRRPFRRWVHQHIVKPCLSSRRRLAAHVQQECEGANSVIDVSAGDDTIALSLAKAGLELVVANDIAFADVQRMGAPRSRRPPANLILTSRPVEHLEFDRRFDVALLKNTLHHFTTAAEVSASLRALERLASRLVFVEIEDPSLSMRGRAWNYYYERLLGDGGDDHRFYDMHTFRQGLRRHFPEAAARFGSIRTGRGNYLVATLDLQGR